MTPASLLLPALALLPLSAFAADKFVTNRNDSGPGSLRAAITSANSSSGVDTLVFSAIPDAGISGTVVTITLASPLPPITDTLNVDGGTAINYSASAARPVVVLDGVNAGANAVGLDVQAPNCVIHAISLVRWSGSGLRFLNANATTATGCWIGLHPDQTPMGNEEGLVVLDSSNSTIGGIGNDWRNVISNNTSTGIRIYGESSDGTQIWNCRIGTTPDGEFAQPNGGAGIIVTEADNTIIGGSLLHRCYIGRNSVGIQLYAGADSTQIIGCNIGTSAALNDLGNRVDGIRASGCANLLISGNSIGWNAGVGIGLHSDSGTGYCTGARIVGNTIGQGAGVDAPNGNGGITIQGAPGAVIGTALAPNIIAGNDLRQVYLNGAGADDCVLHGNTISGNANPSAFRGVDIAGAKRIRLGGLNAGEGNRIIRNLDAGVLIDRIPGLAPAPDRVSSGNLIQGNEIGSIDALRRNHKGIDMRAGEENEIAGNFIFGNTYAGIQLSSQRCRANIATGNAIGQNPGNDAAAGNAIGICLHGAQANIIGTAAAPNTIVSSSDRGIYIGADTSGNLSRDNLIRGNSIGIAVNGLPGWSIQPEGISVAQPGGNNIIGGAGAGDGNKFAGNTTAINFTTKNAADGQLTIQGNTFGIDSIAPHSGNQTAFVVSGARGAQFIGNTVRYCYWGAVYIVNYEESVPDFIQITSNTFSSNGGLPVDLGVLGPNPQDGATGDADSGPNGLIDYPEILSVRTGANYEVTGRVRTTPLTSVRVHLYSGPSVPLGPTAYTEPQNYLGASAQVFTNAAGLAFWRVSVPAPVTGAMLTATTTRVDSSPGATSEFSPGVSFDALRTARWGVLDIRREGDDILLDVPTLPGVPTEIRTNTATTGTWSLLQQVSGTGGIMTFRHSGAIPGAARRFYRAQEIE